MLTRLLRRILERIAGPSSLAEPPRGDAEACCKLALAQAVVRPGHRVLEIGTGSGLVAMMAARAGASQVFTCEMLAPIA